MNVRNTSISKIRHLLQDGVRISVKIQYGFITHYTNIDMVQMPRDSHCCHCSNSYRFLYSINLPYYRNNRSYVKAYYCRHCILSNIAGYIVFEDLYCCIAGRALGIVPMEHATKYLARACLGFYVQSNHAGVGFEIHIEEFKKKCNVCREKSAMISINVLIDFKERDSRFYYCWKCYYY